MEIKISANSERNAVNAEDAALAEVDRLNKILSGYDNSSEFSRWMKADKKPIAVSTQLYEVLSLFEQWRIKSSGALDASAETISKLWRDAGKQNRVPASAEIINAVKLVRKQHYILNEQDHTAQRFDDAPLILNSFAKSYIMNKAANAVLASGGVAGVVVNIGGDILVLVSIMNRSMLAILKRMRRTIHRWHGSKSITRLLQPAVTTGAVNLLEVKGIHILLTPVPEYLQAG